ncbi:aspartate-semialdehyde dehydrogenase [Candidatus Geothermarchaeota archaeon]|nr:MAG: aspartate-semialdehyde dehydrogenase [Candidatus Geothermarchaeota archaeon]
MDRIKVAILGATGLVGQHFVKLLHKHPWFEIVALSSSPLSAGKIYRKVVKWYISGEMPEEVADIEVLRTDVDVLRKEGVELVFSALPSKIAREVEPRFASAGIPVISDASAFRMEQDVPILIPEVNYDHLKLTKLQMRRRGWRGFIITNPNCTAAVLALSLKPIFDEFGIKELIMVSMQAISGAGYKGLPSMAIFDNIIPYIPEEEEKVEREMLKMFGRLHEGVIRRAEFRISCSCNRVLVYNGHTEVVFVKTDRKAHADDVKKAMRRFKSLPQNLNLPSAPSRPIVVRDEMDRPQPRLDRNEYGGMSVVVGRIREDPVLEGIKYVALGHNLIRGAAGNAVLSAELAYRMSYI